MGSWCTTVRVHRRIHCCCELAVAVLHRLIFGARPRFRLGVAAHNAGGGGYFYSGAVRVRDRMERLCSPATGRSDGIRASVAAAGGGVGMLALASVLFFGGRYLQTVIPDLVCARGCHVCCLGAGVCRNKRQPVLTMLMHAAVNNFKNIVPSAANNPTSAVSLHPSRVM